MKLRLTGLFLALSVMTGSFPAMAENPLLIKSIQEVSLPVNKVAVIGYETNPATMYYRDSISLSAIAAIADYNSSKRPVMEQNGTGRRLLTLGANSYRRLPQQLTVWGDASFTTGSYRDVKWTDCIDYEYIAPYVLGDEVGGNMTTQCYRFSGGIAKNINKWTLGAQLRYRAEIAYRNRDPRIKTVVSDLDLKLGAALRISSKRIIGIAGGLSVYNQNCDLDFYNPINDINTYTLTGMGTYYKRFMGNTNKNSGYNSLGFSAAAQMLTTDKSGLKVSVAFDSYRMNQQLRNYNNLTLGFSDNTIVSGTVSYRIDINNKLTIEPIAKGYFSHRKGTENLFGTSVGASYDKIGSNSYYRHNRFTGVIAVPAQLNTGHNTYLTLTPHCALTGDEERYATPLRKTDVTHVTPGIAAAISTNHGAWLWNLAINGEYRMSHAQTPIWTDLDTTSALGQCQLNNYSMLEAESIKGDIKLNATRRLGTIALNGTLFYSIQHFRNICYANTAGIAVGVIF